MNLSRTLLPDLQTLQAFEAAARHESFTRAAAELRLTQSAVSRQIRDLEARLGVRLFERVRQRVVLSDAGAQLRPEVERILDHLHRLSLRAAGSRNVTGLLTIATLPTFGSRWLTPRLPAFLAQHPGVQITMLSRSDPFDLRAAGVDAAIHYGQPDWPGATCTYLCGETVVPVAAPVLRRRYADALFDAAPRLHLASRPMLWADWLGHNGHGTDTAFVGHRFDHFSLLIEAAVAGVGVGLVPTYLIERELREGTLDEVVDAPLRTDAAYYVALPDEHVSKPLCRAFEVWIRGQVPA